MHGHGRAVMHDANDLSSMDGLSHSIGLSMNVAACLDVYVIVPFPWYAIRVPCVITVYHNH